MKLIPVSLNDEAIKAWAPHWMPFLPSIARRSKEPIQTLFNRIVSKEMRLALVWDDAVNRAVALIGVRLHYRGDDLIGEWLWMVGSGRKSWEHLLPELEQLLRAAGCVECRPLCRVGWTKILKRNGYKVTHIEMEKSLMEKSDGRFK